MKTQLLLLLAIFSLLSTSALAKENGIKSSTQEKILDSVSIDGERREMDSEIKSFDFQKVFAETESYFKAAKNWKKLKCEPKTGFLCNKRSCDKREAKTYLVLNKKKSTITRCEGDFCEQFPASFEQTGVFYNIQTEGPVGTLIRVLGDNRYKEVTTVGLDAYVANGNCAEFTDE